MLRERAEQLAALPILERIEGGMSSAADEIQPAVAQFLVRLGDWVEQLELRREAFFLEESHLDRRDGGAIGRRNQVGNRDGQAHWIPASRTAPSQSARPPSPARRPCTAPRPS